MRSRPCVHRARGATSSWVLGLLLLAAGPLSRFINANPTVVMLALGFLLMIGMTLIADGMGFHVPKGYVYAAMGFSALPQLPGGSNGEAPWAGLALTPALNARLVHSSNNAASTPPLAALPGRRLK